MVAGRTQRVLNSFVHKAYSGTERLNRMREKILVIDDVAEERKTLVDAINGKYFTYQADGGKKGLQTLANHEDEIGCIVLDMEMPDIDGLHVLATLHERKILTRIPVVCVTNDTSAESEIRAYGFPIADYLRKPINPVVFFMRLRGALRLTASVDQQDLFSANVLDMFGDIVEGRDTGGAVHIDHIKNMTRTLAENLMEMYPEYKLTQLAVDEIVEASALHDIGKVAIPDHVLNKPGKLTAEEFDLMKSHTTKGGEMIERMASVLSIVHPNDAEHFIDVAHNICRHHHERFDGRDYPDRLTGDDIPIEAQIVSISDTLDGMTGRTVYKRAIEKEKAFHMIVSGEAGVFSPKLLECMRTGKSRMMDIIGEQDLH